LRGGAATIVDPLQQSTELYIGRQAVACEAPRAEEWAGVARQ